MQNKYEVLGIVGEGAYGIVYKCKNKETGEFVAIKKFKESDDEIVKKTMRRELKTLKILKNENCVQFQDAFKRKNNLFLVFEYVDRNLLELLETQPNGLNPALIKNLIYQLCKAIHYLHSENIIHRDIKPENLLITNDMRLKLCDFGFARKFSSTQPLTDYVATRWYRSPELLITNGVYGPEVDYWAIGCIMGELADGNPLFPGENETDQLHCIEKVLGNLPPDQVEMFYTNPIYNGKKLIDVTKPETLEKRYMGKLSPLAISFMKGLLELDPKKRLNSKTVFNHPYFANYMDNKATSSHRKQETNNLVTQRNSVNKATSGEPSINVNSRESSVPREKDSTTISTTNINNIINYNVYNGVSSTQPEATATVVNNATKTNNVNTTINIVNVDFGNNSNNPHPQQHSNVHINNHKRDNKSDQIQNQSQKFSPNQKVLLTKKNPLSTISMPLNNTMTSLKTFPKKNVNPLVKTSHLKKTNSVQKPAQMATSVGFNKNYSKNMNNIRDVDLYKTFFKNQNDKYNFNINTQFGSNYNSYRVNYNNLNTNNGVIYEIPEYQEPKKQSKVKNVYSNSKKKNHGYPSNSMYGNFGKKKDFQLPMLSVGRLYNFYKK